MKCQCCNAEAPTRQVIFRQNIALFLIRFPSKAEGSFCKPCIHRFFWKMTLTSLVAGWWGLISFFANIFFICGNVSTYFHCLGMPVSEETPRDAAGRVVIAPAFNFSTERIARYRDEMTQLLAAGEPVTIVCAKIARLASAPESDVLDYINEHPPTVVPS
jgi:hypothetical protein